MADDARLVAVADQWVSHRDRMRARHTIQEVRQKEFLAALNGYANQLGTILPSMSIDQMEGLLELTSTLLNQRRASAAQFTK